MELILAPRRLIRLRSLSVKLRFVCPHRPGGDAVNPSTRRGKTPRAMNSLVFTHTHTLRSDQGQPVLVHRETALLTGAALPGLQRPPGTVATHDRCCGRRGVRDWMGSPREGGTADLLGIPCDTARRPRTAACAALTAPLLSITRTLCPPHRPPLRQMSL